MRFQLGSPSNVSPNRDPMSPSNSTSVSFPSPVARPVVRLACTGPGASRYTAKSGSSPSQPSLSDPVRRSSPAPPTRPSMPAPPSMSSFPSFPQMRPSPPSPSIVSLPARPMITSSSRVPTMMSSPGVPTVVGVSPRHFGTELDDALDAMGTATATAAAAAITQWIRFNLNRMVLPSLLVLDLVRTLGPVSSARNRAGPEARQGWPRASASLAPHHPQESGPDGALVGVDLDPGDHALPAGLGGNRPRAACDPRVRDERLPGHAQAAVPDAGRACHLGRVHDVVRILVEDADECRERRSGLRSVRVGLRDDDRARPLARPLAPVGSAGSRGHERDDCDHGDGQRRDELRNGSSGHDVPPISWLVCHPVFLAIPARGSRARRRVFLRRGQAPPSGSQYGWQSSARKTSTAAR